MEELLVAALAARENAYVPYSKFKVGASLMTAAGKIYSGCNVENASYGLCNCAERTEVFKAISDGEREFKALLVVAETPEPTALCGACRQVIAEFNIPEIIMCNLNGKIKVVKLAELLPYAFSGKDINNTGDC